MIIKWFLRVLAIILALVVGLVNINPNYLYTILSVWNSSIRIPIYQTIRQPLPSHRRNKNATEIHQHPPMPPPPTPPPPTPARVILISPRTLLYVMYNIYVTYIYE